MSEEKSESKRRRKWLSGLKRWWPQHKPGWLTDLILQAILIVFSVLLALGLNEWRAEAKREQEVAVALTAIRSEMEQNLEKLERAANRHTRVYDTLTYFSTAGQMPPPEIYLGGLFSPADLLSTAWETTVQKGLTDQLSYQRVLELSEVYNYQEQYEALGNSIAQASYIQILNLGSERFLKANFENWALVVRDFASREEGLQRQLREILEKY